MRLLTIGAFAKASRLSPKALRLYDELGLLRPAVVDPVTGYRRYAPDQLDRARLVGWLRRLGMPLARVQHVCALADAETVGTGPGPAGAGPAETAAQEVRAYWAQAEAETAARRDLATFLVDHLTRKDPTLTSTTQPLGIRGAALSDTGLVRESNQDTAYAGARLLAVADGFGPAGGPASAAAVGALKHLETPEALRDRQILDVLEESVESTRQAVRAIATEATDAHEASEAQEAHDASEAHDVGTTLTAMLWTGDRLALVHIGDSRACLLRDGEFFQLTHDHTVVQALLDEGRITPEEETSHPRPALLHRALGGDANATPDVRLHEVRPGDRYLLCSDGLSAVVPADEVRRVIATVDDPDEAVRELVALANSRGGPDNVSCVVADVLELPEPGRG